MLNQIPSSIVLGYEVAGALRAAQPVVALESAVITHGLPRPENLELAKSLEPVIREENVTPATVGLLDGKVHVGLSAEELERLAEEDGARKISRRDFGIALARGENGGTTVAGTLIAARLAGIRVFATGGIGGVHRTAPGEEKSSPLDVSADLHELSRSPLVVVCAGAKAILDLPATVEMLETLGVCTLGYGTDEFPAFYSRESGLPVTAQADTPQDVAQIARAQWNLGLESALLVVQPPPTEAALPANHVEGMIQQALKEAAQKKVSGAAVTPFLLDRVRELSGGESLQTNLALLRNNARLAARIAAAIQPRRYI